DRQTKSIQDVKAGDEVMAYDAKTRLLVPAKVQEVTIHEKPGLAITGVWITPVQEVSASLSLTKPVLLEATANHPVQTATGAKKLGDLRTGDVLYRFDGATNTVSAWKVADVQSSIR